MGDKYERRIGASGIAGQEGLRSFPSNPSLFLCMSAAFFMAPTSLTAMAMRSCYSRDLAAERVSKQSAVQTGAVELEVMTGLAGGYSAMGSSVRPTLPMSEPPAQWSNWDTTRPKKRSSYSTTGGLSVGCRTAPAAEKAFRRAIEISRTNRTEDTVLPALLHNYSLALRELGRLTEARITSSARFRKLCKRAIRWLLPRRRCNSRESIGISTISRMQPRCWRMSSRRCGAGCLPDTSLSRPWRPIKSFSHWSRETLPRFATGESSHGNR